MNILIKKPILVAGISLSFLLWLGQKVTTYWDNWNSIFSLICLGAIFYLLSKLSKEKAVNKFKIADLTKEDLSAKITSIKNQINSLISESKELEKNIEKQNIFSHLEQKIETIQKSFPKEKLEIALLNISHKTNGFELSQNLEKIFSQLINVNLINDNIADINYLANKQNNPLILNYDLLIIIVSEDLTQSQKNIISDCHKEGQKVLIVFDDINYSLPEDKKLIFDTIKQALDSLIEEKYIISISSKKQTIKVRKYDSESNYQEWQESTEINQDNLVNTLHFLCNNEIEKLTLLTTYRNAIALEKDVRKELNIIRRNKSLTVAEKYQIVAATATFANPVSSLDLLATAAINAQMIVDLSKIYQHPLSLNQAQQISLTLAKVMLKLGIVEISTQTVTAILKTNMITFVAGGLIQGVSAAYLTRLCAISLIEYYEVVELNVNEGINISKVKEKIEWIFAQNKGNNFFEQFVQKTSLLFS